MSLNAYGGSIVTKPSENNCLSAEEFMLCSHYMKISLSHLRVNKRELTKKLGTPVGCDVSRCTDKTKRFIDFSLTLKSSTTKEHWFTFWRGLDKQGEVLH